MVFFDLLMTVPRLSFAMPDLDETHSSFEQPARDQELPGLRPATVKVADVLRLTQNIKRVGRIHLHPVSELKGLHSSFKLRVILAALKMRGIELMQQVDLSALFPG